MINVFMAVLKQWATSLRWGKGHVTFDSSCLWHCCEFIVLSGIVEKSRIWSVVWNSGWRSVVWTPAEWHEPPLSSAQHLKPACLSALWVFWVIKSCCWPDDEEPDAHIVSREGCVRLYKGRPQLDTHWTRSNWPGTIFFLDTARIILMGAI